MWAELGSLVSAGLGLASAYSNWNKSSSSRSSSSSSSNNARNQAITNRLASNSGSSSRSSLPDYNTWANMSHDERVAALNRAGIDVGTWSNMSHDQRMGYLGGGSGSSNSTPSGSGTTSTGSSGSSSPQSSSNSLPSQANLNDIPYDLAMEYLNNGQSQHNPARDQLYRQQPTPGYYYPPIQWTPPQLPPLPKLEVTPPPTPVKIEQPPKVEVPAGQPQPETSGPTQDVQEKGPGGFVEQVAPPTVAAPSVDELYRIYKEVTGGKENEAVRQYLASPQFQSVLGGRVPMWMSADPVWRLYLIRLGYLPRSQSDQARLNALQERVQQAG